MFKSKDEILITFILGTAVILIFSLIIILSILLFKLRQRQYLREKELLGVNFEQEILRSQLEIQEQTFKTISQELHDNVGQILTLAKLNLSTIDLGIKGKAIEKIDDAIELLSKAIQDVRDVSKTLNTDTIAKVGINRAIELELGIIERASSVITIFEVNGEAFCIDSQQELILFRIVQEALHNAIKHSRATEIKVLLCFTKGKLELSIFDNGKGFDSTNAGTMGSGLHNMKHRCALIGGEITIASTTGEGTRVAILLPLGVQ